MDSTNWLNGFAESALAVMNQVAAFAPRIVAAVALLLGGWLLARLCRYLGTRLVSGLDHLWSRLVLRAGMEKLQPRHPPTKIVGELIFWLVVLFFLTAATQVLGLDIFVTWLSQLVAYLPVLGAGLLIILAGFIASSLARDLVTTTAVTAGLARADQLGVAAQVLILLSTAVIGLAQIGIDVTFLSLAAGIILAATLGAVALSFALGARQHAGNVIAAHHLREVYEPGDRIRIAGLEGKVVEMTATAVILDSAEGRVMIPAQKFLEETSVLISAEEPPHED